MSENKEKLHNEIIQNILKNGAYFVNFEEGKIEFCKDVDYSLKYDYFTFGEDYLFKFYLEDYEKFFTDKEDKKNELGAAKFITYGFKLEPWDDCRYKDYTERCKGVIYENSFSLFVNFEEIFSQREHNYTRFVEIGLHDIENLPKIVEEIKKYHKDLQDAYRTFKEEEIYDRYLDQERDYY